MGESRSLRAGVAIAAALLFAPLFVPLATGRMFVVGDLSWFHIPVRYLYGQALAAGDSILWTPALFRGFYVHGEGQLGALHPLHLVLYRVLPLAPAVSLEIIAVFAFALAGMYLFLRRLGAAAAASAFGGLMFAFSGYHLLNLQRINLVAVAAHLPWIALGVHGLFDASARRRAAAFATLACAVGSALLLGYPHVLAMGLLFAGGYALIRALASRQGVPLALAASAVAAGGAIGGAQVLPTLHFLASSGRAVASADFAQTYSLHPWNLLQLWSPFALRMRVYADPSEFQIHEFSIYNGAFCTVALCWLLVRAERIPRSVKWGTFAVCVVATLLALGRYGGLNALLSQAPLFDRFRGPARFIVVVHFGLALAAALTMDDVASRASLRVRAWRPLWPLLVPVGLSAIAALVALAVFTGPGVPINRVATVPRLVQGFLLIASCAALLAGATRGSALALAVLPVFAAVDIGLWGQRFNWTPPPMATRELAALFGVPAEAGSRAVLYSHPDANLNIAILGDRWLAHAYAGMITSRVVPHDDPLGHRLSGVNWTRDQSGGWHPIADTMPLARLVTDVRVSTNILQDLRAIDISRAALAGEPLPPLSGTPGDARVTSHRPGWIVVETASDVPALLILTETFDAGWTAADRATPLPTLRVNGDYLGAVVPAGVRAVTFTFSSADTRHGILLSMAGLVVTVAMTAVLLRRA